MKKTIYIYLLILLTSFNLEAQDIFVVKGSHVPKTNTAAIYVPKNYSKTQKYPAVFMLHGWSGNYEQWGNITDLQYYADTYGMVIICPDGYYDSWYLNSSDKSKIQFETFFFKTFAPKVILKYNLDVKNLFITGLSMGGHGALYLFLKKPTFFRSAGSTSGGLSFTKKTTRFGLSKYIGEYNKDEWEKYTVRGNLLNIKGKNKPFIFDCGFDDFFYERNLEIAKLCKKNHLKATFIAQNGKHSKQYWKKSIKAHFDFFKQLVK